MKSLSNKEVVTLINTDKYSLFSVIFTAITILVLLTFFSLFIGSLPTKLPLFYSLPWGEGQLVPKSQFFMLPGILFVIGLVNLGIAAQLHSSQIILKRMLLITSIIVDLLVIISVIKIILIFT